MVKKNAETNQTERYLEMTGKIFLVAIFIFFGFSEVSQKYNRFAEASVAAGNWDGWIKLSNPAAVPPWGVKLNGTEFEGFAYGGSSEGGADTKTHVIGWIDFNPQFDADGGGPTPPTDLGVERPALPSVSISAPLSVNYGTPFTVSWTTGGDLTSCMTGDDWTEGSVAFAPGTHTSQPITPVTDPMTMSISCAYAGGTVSDTKQVGVNAFTLSFSDNPVRVIDVAVEATSTPTTATINRAGPSFSGNIALSCDANDLLALGASARCYFYSDPDDQSTRVGDDVSADVFLSGATASLYLRISNIDPGIRGTYSLNIDATSGSFRKTASLMVDVDGSRIPTVRER